MKDSDRLSSRTARAAAPAAKSAASSSSTADPAKRFGLEGPSLVLDPRIHAYRKDIADIALAGQLIAPHYARAMIRTIARPASLRSEAADSAELLADLAAGEEFAVLDAAGGWAWGYRRKDHKVGYIDAAALENGGAE